MLVSRRLSSSNFQRLYMHRTRTLLFRILDLVTHWWIYHPQPVPVLSFPTDIHLNILIHLLKDAYIHDTQDSKDVIVAFDRTVDVSTPAFCDSSPLPPSSPNIRPFSSLSPISPIASFEADPDILEESTTPGSDCTLVLSTPTDDWKRIDLGIKNDLITYLYVVAKAYAPAAELDGPFEETSLLLTPFQPCQWSEAFLSFYTFPTWCFAGFRTAYDGSIVCDCLCSTRLESCSGETPDGHLNASRLTDGLGDGFPAAFNP